MAHLETPEAVDVPVNDDSATAVMEKYLASEYGDGEEELPSDEAEPEGEPDGEDLELDDADEGEDEPETPAIAPPVSLNATEKAKFAQLPEEAQQLILDVETRRNAQVQEATTKASEAQRTADARAAAANADAKAQAARNVLEFIADYQPVEPKREWYGDDVSYLTACRQYDNESAQFLQKVQRAVDMEAEAETEADAAFVAQRDREIFQHPQIANAETRDGYVKDILALAADVGLDPAVIAKQATGSEFLALAKVFDRLHAAEAKAAKYDTAMSKQMQRVREGKTRTLRPGAAQPERSGREATNAITRLKQTGSDADALAAFTALGM